MGSITATINYTSSIGTHCLVCGDTVPIYHPGQAPKICDKCKAAVMHVRDQLEKEEESAMQRILQGAYQEVSE